MSEIIGKILAEKYLVEDLIRESGIGKVYRGKHLLMEKPVAIKILSPALAIDDNIVQRFSFEAKILSRISHPNIVNVSDFATENAVAFIVLENSDGETLKETIQTQGKFSIERASNIVNQIAAALSNAHSFGVIHKNLSSENIQLLQTLNANDVVKIQDFGIVKIDENDFSDSLPEYLSPEQCSQSSEPDERSDIYSLGVILFEMLAGEVPFSAETPNRVMMKHLQEPPPPILSLRDDLPIDAETVIQRALAKQPIQRYQTATDFAESIKQAINSPIGDGDQNTVIRSKPFGIDGSNEIGSATNPNLQNNIWKTAFIVLAGICMLSGFFIYMTYGKRTNPATEMMLDANGQPVQPTIPATGLSEQELSNMGSYSPELYGNSNINGMAMPMPNDPNPLWDRGGRPPVQYGTGFPTTSGGFPPNSVTNQNGTMIYTDPTSGSQFMPDINDPGRFVLVTPNPDKPASNVTVKPVNANVKSNASVVNTKTANVNKPIKPENTSTPKPSVEPTPKPTKIPMVTPTPKDADEPKNSKPPSATEKRTQSGKVQDSIKY